MTSQAAQLTGFAQELLGRTDAAIVGLWQRSVALLARQALEAAITETLDLRAPGLAQCTARAQLLCLPSYISTGVALEAGYLWSVLSRACHEHPYELAPTWEELAAWVHELQRVIAEMPLAPRVD